MCIRDRSQAGPYTPQQQVYNVKKDQATTSFAPQPQRSLLCSDGQTEVFDLGACPVVPTPTSVAELDKPTKLSQLGILPEFGDSHGLNAVQFFHKLKNRFNNNEADRTYLDELFKSMGYENGFADAQSSMFSEDILAEGTKGVLGFGEEHNYGYETLPASEYDREAFRIASANGAAVHFMKTRGNYFYEAEH